MLSFDCSTNKYVIPLIISLPEFKLVRTTTHFLFELLLCYQEVNKILISITYFPLFSVRHVLCTKRYLNKLNVKRFLGFNRELYQSLGLQILVGLFSRYLGV